MAIILKACGRCGGDLLSDRFGGEDLSCLQCGAEYEVSLVLLPNGFVNRRGIAEFERARAQMAQASA